MVSVELDVPGGDCETGLFDARRDFLGDFLGRDRDFGGLLVWVEMDVTGGDCEAAPVGEPLVFLGGEPSGVEELGPSGC